MGSLQYAAGPAGTKQEYFARNEDFTEICLLGSMGSGKTRGIAMSILFDALNYPGARIALCRAEMTQIKKTTLVTLFEVLSEAGMKMGKEGGNGDYYHFKNDSMIEFYVGEQPATLYYFGLNTGDYKQKLKSFEPMRLYVDEASEVEEHKIEFGLIRCRQKVKHRLTYEQLIANGITEGKWGSFDEGMRHYRVEKKDLEQHPFGKNLVKYVANDEGNNWIWRRMVNPYGDKPHPDADSMKPTEFVEWTNKHLGVTELYVPPGSGWKFRPGNIVALKDKRVGEVTKVKGDHAHVDVGGRTEIVDTNTLTVILERLCLYLFSLENHSLAEDNIEAFYFTSENLRNQYLHGLTDVKSGLMFPEFHPDSHVIPREDIPPDWFVWVGIDYNIDIACASFVAENHLGDLVVFDEFEGFTGNPITNATEILAKINHPWDRVRVFYDNGMDARNPTDPSKTVAQLYREAGLQGMRPAVKDRDYGVNVLKELLSVRKQPGYAARPQLWVMEHCETTIHGRIIDGNYVNMGLVNMTWEDYRAKRRDHYIDSLRYSCASRGLRRSDPTRRKPVRGGRNVPQWVRP